LLHKEVEVEENIIRREETQTIIQEEEVLDLHDKVTPMKTISIFNRQGNTNGKEAVFQTIKKFKVIEMVSSTVLSLSNIWKTVGRNLGNCIPIKELTKGMSETGSQPLDSCLALVPRKMEYLRENIST